MTALGLSSNHYTVGLGRSLTNYDHINDEDELRRLLKDVDDFEEKRKIRARIREIIEKSCYNSSSSYLDYSSQKINRYSDYTSPLRSTYTTDEISQRRRRKGVDESHRFLPAEDTYTSRYSNSSPEDSYSRRSSNTSVDDKYISKRYSNTSIDDKYSSHHYSNTSLDDSSYRRYSNTSIDTPSRRYSSTRKDSLEVFRHDETNDNLQNTYVTEESLPPQMTDYESYRRKKDEEENQEVWNVEEFSKKTITELENLLNATRNFKKRRDIRTVIRTLKERNSNSNYIPSEVNQRKISYDRLTKTNEMPELDKLSINNNTKPIEDVNDYSVTLNIKVTRKPSHELLLNKGSKHYCDDDIIVSKINSINGISRSYTNSSKSMESKIIQEINDLKDVSELQTSINSFTPSQEIISKTDILKEEFTKYPLKRVLSKRSSGYSSIYSSIDDDKEEEKDDVFEKDGNKDHDGDISDPEVEQLRENLKVFAEIQQAKENASFHPTVDEMDDDEEEDAEMEEDETEGMTSTNNSTYKIEEVSNDYPDSYQSSSTTQIVTHPDDEKNIPITIIKEEPEEIYEEINETEQAMENIIAEPVENLKPEPVENKTKIKENYIGILSPKIKQFEHSFNKFSNENVQSVMSEVNKLTAGKEKGIIFERYGKAVTMQKDVIKTTPSKVPVYVAENRRRIIAKMEQFGHNSKKAKMSEEQLANLPNINDEEELQKLLDSSEDYDARKKIRERLKEVRQKRREKTEADLKRREDDREKGIQDKLKASQDQQARTLAMYDEMSKSAPAGGKKTVNIETYKTGEGGTKTVTTTTIKGDSDKDGTKSSTNIKETKSVTISSSKDSKDSGNTLANAQDMINKMSTIPGVTGQVTLTTTTTSYSSKGGAPAQVQTQTKTQTFGTPGALRGMDILSRLGKGMSPAQTFQKLDVQSTQNARPTSPSQLSPSSPARPVTRSPSAIKQMLLDWCAAKTKGYEHVNITNFSSCWNNGMAFCALIHHFCPDAFDYSKLDPKNRRYNFDLAFKAAEDKADIAPLLDTDDMVMMKNPDWKCVFTYVQSFYRRFHNVP